MIQFTGTALNQLNKGRLSPARLRGNSMEDKDKNNKRKKIILTVIIAVFVISGVSIQFPNLIHDFLAKRFINKWALTFTNCKSFDCIYTTSGMKPDYFYKRTFENGEWVIAINSNACMRVGGFNASLFYGSDGILYYQMGYKYCNQAIFTNELDSIKIGELTQFYDKLPYRLQQWKG